MKVALCLHGISKGKNNKYGGLPVNFEEEAKLYKKNYIIPNNADVFIHSWKNNDINSILNMYSPVDYLFEESKIFRKNSLKTTLLNSLRSVTGKKVEHNRLNNIFSRWYSFYKVIDLLNQHENKINQKYDIIMVSRFDLSLFSSINLNFFEKNKFIVPTWCGYRDSLGRKIPEDKIYLSLDKKYKYIRGFPYDDEGLLDFWFISSSNIIKEFANIYNELDKFISNVGLSNHKIALEKIKEMQMLSSLQFRQESYSDFCLTRWMLDA